MNDETASSSAEMAATAFSASLHLAYGIPEVLVVDNGLDLASHGTRDACAALGIDLLFTPVRSPWYKGTIERVGRSMNTRFVHWLPGTTLGRATSDLGYNGADRATMTIEAFTEMFENGYVPLHNLQPRRDKLGTPVRRFVEGIQQWPVRVPSSMDEFDAAIALTTTRVLQQTGLWFLGIQYQNEVLGELWKRMPEGRHIVMKVNPLDLHTVQVRHPMTGQHFPVNAVSDLRWPRSLSFHAAVRAHAKKSGLNAAEASDLTKAENNLRHMLEQAHATSKRTLRRLQAQILQEAQRAVDSEVQQPAPPSEATGHEVVAALLAEAFDDDENFAA